jgi:hypothetical protein
VAHDARPLTPWPMTPRMGHAKGPLLAAPTAVGHDVRGLVPLPTKTDVYFFKFVGDHIFLQNRDNINIEKNSQLAVLPLIFTPETWALSFRPSVRCCPK